MDQSVKELIEKVKETACAAGKAAGTAMDAATKKAGEAFESTKLALTNFDLNTDIELLYKEIGRCVYLTHTGVQVDAETISEKIEQIDAKYARIEANKHQIAFRKSAVICPKCGRECTQGDLYCSNCGHKF